MQTNEQANRRQRAEALRSAAQLAILAQDACNLSGVLASFTDICMNTLWPEARARDKGTDWVNAHPIVTVFLDKLSDLNGRALESGVSYSKAWDAVNALRDAVPHCERCDNPISMYGCILSSAELRVTAKCGAPRGHTADEQCTVDPDTELCSVCGARHGMPCEECSGRAFHSPGCSRSDENSYVMEEDDPAAQKRSAPVASEHDETRFLERIKLLSRNVGSISHATMREEDLIPRFAGALLDLGKLLSPEHKALGERAGVLYDRLESTVEAGEEAFWKVVAERFPEATAGDLEIGTSAHLSTAMEEAVKEWVGLNVQEPMELVVELIDALNDYAPEGFYFGAHPGDGSDYGFWMHEDFLERCAEDDIPVFDDSSEAPDDIQGPYVVISDHGNVSFYFAGRSETVTQWAVV